MKRESRHNHIQFTAVVKPENLVEFLKKKI